jgi:hypothetical protein
MRQFRWHHLLFICPCLKRILLPLIVNLRNFEHVNTKPILALSALYLGATGILLSFAPHELLQWLSLPVADGVAIFLQMSGALSMGLAVTNWMSKGSKIGGIYGKPLIVGNFAHFFIGFMTLAKSTTALALHPVVCYAFAAIYLAGAACFGYLFFYNPATPEE